MIGRHHLLSGENRIDKGDMHRAKNNDLVSRRQHTGRPGQRFEILTFSVHIAAIAMPTCDRQEKLKPGLFRQTRCGNIVLPRRVPKLRCLGHGETTRAVLRKQPQLELVWTVDARLFSVHFSTRFNLCRKTQRSERLYPR